MRLFLAGAAGAVGARLVPLLLAAGHQVTGTTRSPEKAAALRAAGVEPVVVDVFDAQALTVAAVAARPYAVIHQLTDLPSGLDPARMAAAIEANARIRDQGTRNLVAAAIEAGARRLIAQSIAWIYAPGREPHAESDPLDSAADGSRAVSIAGVVSLEQQVTSAPLQGVVLRYGRLYGPGTGMDQAAGPPALHVDAAAAAALLAVDRGAGLYNIADGDDVVATAKARRELGWDPAFRLA